MGIHHLVKNIVVGTMLALLSHISLADPLAQAAAITSLDHDTQALKKAVLDLNKELFLLEEELLYPANTQVAVFVSMDVGQYFALESVQLTMDGKDVGNYLYTEREVDALHRGRCDDLRRHGDGAIGHRVRIMDDKCMGFPRGIRPKRKVLSSMDMNCLPKLSFPDSDMDIAEEPPRLMPHAGGSYPPPLQIARRR